MGFLRTSEWYGFAICTTVLTFVLRFIMIFFWGKPSDPADFHVKIFNNNATYITTPPFHSELLQGEYLIKKWTRIGGIWSFSSLFGWFVMVTPLGIGGGVLDLLITEEMSKGLKMISPFIPHASGACKESESWQAVNGTNGTENIFTIMSMVNATGPTAKYICERWVVEYQWGIAVSVLQGICAVFILLPWTLFLWSAFIGDGGTQETFDSFNGVIWIWRFLTCCIPASIKFRIELVFRILFKFAIGSIRPLTRRSISKTPKKHNIEMRQLTHRFRRREDIPVIPNPLTDFLNFDILTLVASELHYVDIKHLSQASRGLHALIYPDGDDGTTFRQLKHYACSDGSKSACWLCYTPICSGCRMTYTQPIHPIEFHKHCLPHCTSCYFRTHLRKRAGYKGSCHCPSGRLPNRHTAGQRREDETWFICRNCTYHRSAEEREEALARRRELQRRKMEEFDEKCAGCRRQLTRWGVRWWVCGRCRFECRNWLHVPWRWGYRGWWKRRGDGGKEGRPHCEVGTY